MTDGSARRRIRRGIGIVGPLLAVGLLWAVTEGSVDPAGPADPDRRIAFYRPRTGGPGTYVAWARLGQAYLDRGHATGRAEDLVRAERCLERSLAYQSNLDALRGLAALRLEQHRFGEALELARDAVSAAPGDQAAQAALFDAHLALGQLDEAEVVVERMLGARATFEALSRRALLARRHGDLDAAMDFMGRACEAAAAAPGLEDAQAWCLAQLGELHRLRCEPDEAERAYARALDLRPGHALAREHLAELRAAEGRLDEAVSLYRALLVERDDPLLRAALAESYAAEGEGRRAADERAGAVRRMRRTVARGSLAELRPLALLLLDDPASVAEGLGLAERDWGNRQDVLAADTLAWARFRNAQAGDALEVLEPFLESGGLEPATLIRAATMLEARGRPERARELLDRLPACPSALDLADRETAAALAADQSRR